MTVTVRVVDADEMERCERLRGDVFGIPVDAERLADVLAVREMSRTSAAFLDRTPVAVLSAYSLRLAVPGGDVPVAALAALAVRGDRDAGPLERALLGHHIRDARRRREPLAALHALAAPRTSYVDAGFAVASHAVNWHGPRPEPPGEVAGVRVRPLDHDRLGRLAGPVYEAVRARTPGAVSRPDRWWQRLGRDRAGTGWLLATAGTGPAGFAAYQVVDSAGNGRCLVVRELVAAQAHVRRALWRHLLGTNSTSGISVDNRPVGDRLPGSAATGAVRCDLIDGVWLRMIDVPAALAARRYAAPVDVVIEVRDDMCGWNAGRYSLRAGPDGAECTRAACPPDAGMSVADLAAAYLGGVRLEARTRRGPVTERVPGTLARLDRAFAWPTPAWAMTRF